VVKIVPGMIYEVDRDRFLRSYDYEIVNRFQGRIVLQNTGNNHTHTVDLINGDTMRCSCWDAKRNHICKHIIAIMRQADISFVAHPTGKIKGREISYLEVDEINKKAYIRKRRRNDK
jgi:hypothetical protein